MVPKAAFDGGSSPIGALRDRLRTLTADFEAGREVREAVEVYGDGDLRAHHDRFCAVVDRQGERCETVGDLHRTLDNAAKCGRIHAERAESLQPLWAGTAYAGGMLTLSGLGYAALTHGAWCSGGLVAAGVGVALGFVGGLLLHRTSLLTTEAGRTQRDASHALRWADRLPAAEPPPEQDLDPTHMSREDRQALLARLEAEIREAEQKQDGRIDRQGHVVNIAGVKVEVRRP